MSSDASSTSGPRSLHDPWRTIHNPITGEVLTFLESGVEQCVFDLVIPSGRVPVVTHRHPGTENFHVLGGRLHLTVDGVPHDLEVGQQHTVHQEFHAPTNVSGADVTVRVTAKPGYFAERGIRVAFGLARDGRIAADGKPKDLLSLALVSENGQYMLAGPPPLVWRALMTVLTVAAKLAGRRTVLNSYLPPDLPRPW